MDLVSIIIPTYKTNESLKKAVDSVLNQTYENIEVIVVDDNNPDTEYRKFSENLMKQYSKNSKVKYIQHETNKNGAAARNSGFAVSNGKYIGFLDDDDYYLPNKIEAQVKSIANSSFDASTCYFYRNGQEIKIQNKDNYVEDIMLGLVTPSTPSLLIKRECYQLLGGFDESYFRHQDYEFLLRFFDINKKIKLVEEPLFVVDSNGVVNVPKGEKMDILKNKFLKEFDFIIDKFNLNRKKVYGYNMSVVCFAYLKNGEIKKCFSVLKKNFNFYTLFFLLRRCLKGIFK